MRAAVGDVIAMRAMDPRGLNRMVGVSLAAHLFAVVALFIVPRDWLQKFNHCPVVNPLAMLTGGSSSCHSPLTRCAVRTKSVPV